MATEIKSEDDFRLWLVGRTDPVARIIAIRATLRVFPLMFPIASKSEFSAILFRASSLAWVASAYPIHANKFSQDAFAAAENAGALRNMAPGAAAAAVVNAVTGVAYCATDTVDGAPAFALITVKAAATAYNAATAAAFGYALAGAIKEVGPGGSMSAAVAALEADLAAAKQLFWESVSADAIVLSEGFAPDILANRAVWPEEIPPSIAADWQALVQALPPNEDWDIWTAWYNRRLEGRSYRESYELVFARVPDEQWEKGAAAANAWIKAELEKLEPKAIPNVASVFTFGWNEAKRIALSSGPQNLPVFPYPGNEADHRRRLEAERTQVERLISDIAQKQANIRLDYLESLRRYAGDLPDTPGTGNFLLADGEARILRALFESEADFLPRGFASRLKIVLEQHIALRAFYPEVERLYLDVRKGRLEEPLPQDAVEKATRTIAENTPTFFEPEVTAGLKEVEREPPQISLSEEDRAAHAPGVILPPADPIGTLDLKKSRDFTTAAAFNKLLEVAEKGDKVASGVEGWGKVYQMLSDHIGPMIEWLSRQGN